MVRAPVEAPRRSSPPRDLVTDIGLIVAALGSAALGVLAATFPVAGTTVGRSGAHGLGDTTTTTARTLVETDGATVELLVLLPLAAVVTMAVVLRRRRGRGRAGAGPAAWAVVGAVAVVCLLGALTIGPLLLPVAAGLVLAAAGASARSADRP